MEGLSTGWGGVSLRICGTGGNVVSVDSGSTVEGFLDSYSYCYLLLYCTNQEFHIL